MIGQKALRIPAVYRVLLAISACSTWGQALTVTDLKGRSIEIEVISVSGDSVTFLRQGNPQKFTLPVAQFDAASQELIRNEPKPEAVPTPAVAPKIQADVVIGKRRKAKDGSYYMVKQEVTCTVKLTNLSKTEEVPAAKGTIVFIGQNSRTPSLLKVLSTQKLDKPMKTGETVTQEMDAFFTSYDSDNKGAGNVGGYQYYGYILTIQDADGKFILTETTTGSFRLALANKKDLLTQVISYSTGTALDEKLETSSPTNE